MIHLSVRCAVLVGVALGGCVGSESEPIGVARRQSEIGIDPIYDLDVSGGMRAEPGSLRGVFALATIESDDPRVPVGHTVSGTVDIEIFEVEGELQASFDWQPLREESMLRYTFAPTIERRPDGRLSLTSTQIALAVDYLGTCPRRYVWGEEIDPDGRGVGTTDDARIRMDIRTRVTSPQGVCDAPESGVYHETAVIAVSTDRPDVCYGDEDCDEGLNCTADELCLPPPECLIPEVPCPDVCTGFCSPL